MSGCPRVCCRASLEASLTACIFIKKCASSQIIDAVFAPVSAPLALRCIVTFFVLKCHLWYVNVPLKLIRGVYHVVSPALCDIIARGRDNWPALRSQSPAELCALGMGGVGAVSCLAPRQRASLCVWSLLSVTHLGGGESE